MPNAHPSWLGGGAESSRLLCMHLIYGTCLLFPIIMHKCETMVISTMASLQEQLKIDRQNKSLILNNASVHKE